MAGTGVGAGDTAADRAGAEGQDAGKARLRFTVLGCGSSGGVPRPGDVPGGDWGLCDPAEPKNRRSRCALLVERITAQGTTRILVDTGPDLRDQLIRAGVGWLDAVIYTHAHADHFHGIDDLRLIVLKMGEALPVWASQPCAARIEESFGYIFRQPAGSLYPPICRMNHIHGPFAVTGAGGPLAVLPFPVDHGGPHTFGFRFGGLAYVPDIIRMTPEAWEACDDLAVWVVDALRPRPHPTHSHLDQTLGWIERARPRRAVLTDMHHDLDWASLRASLPAGVEPAFDGLVIELEE